jgi:hypothetical protein
MELISFDNQIKTLDTEQKHQSNTEILVRNFVNQYRKPFSIEMVAGYTGIAIQKLKPLINMLITEQQVKIVSTTPEPIYVKANRYMGIYEKTTDNNRWNFDPEKAMILLNEIKNNKHTGVRSIGKAIGKSRQWVYVYLEALASVGVVGRKKGYYAAASTDRIWSLGSQIEKGILRNI